MALLLLLQRTLPDASQMLGFWGQLWAYVTLGATSIVTEEAAPLLGGVAAQQGHLGLVRVALAITLGTWGSHIGLYYLGRWRGKWMRARWPKFGRYLTRALRFVRRYPWRSSIAVRYAYGLRLALPMACGAARVPIVTYVIGSGISALTWSSLFTVIGWAFGRTAMQVLRHMKRFEDVIILAGVGAVGIAIFALTRRGQRVAAASVADMTPTPTGEYRAFGTPGAGTPAVSPNDGERRSADSTPPGGVERRRGERRRGA
jgi:membrane protein DedA with SNARE-associated domain